MKGPQRIAVTVWLALSLLGLQGLICPHAVEHASQHAPYQAGVHSTVLCTWMCVTGNMLDDADEMVFAGRSPIGRAEPVALTTVLLLASRTVSLRGPPCDPAA